MAQIPYHDASGTRGDVLEVDESIFGSRVHLKLLHQVVVAYEANRRQGTASTKGKGAVQGSGRKPWMQKKTGRARHGMIRSPIWKGGGIVHGPHPRSHRHGMNASMRRTALDSALLGKIRDGELRVIERLDFKAPRTKEMRKILEAVGLKGGVLIAVEAHEPNRWLSARNLPKVRMVEARALNAYEVLRGANLLLTRPAFEALVQARRGSVTLREGAA